MTRKTIIGATMIPTISSKGTELLLIIQQTSFHSSSPLRLQVDHQFHSQILILQIRH